MKEEKKRKEAEEKELKKQKNSKNVSANSSMSKPSKNTSYYKEVEEQILSDTEGQQLVKLVGTEFVNAEGQKVKYDFQSQMLLTVVVVGARWSQSCRKLLSNLFSFQQRANK